MKRKTKRKIGCATRRRGAAHGSASWFDVKDRLPNSGDRVISIYKGVLGPRIVTFWMDHGGGTHFGHPNELDGKGSQPATHWCYIPDMPNDKLTRGGANPE